jgi:hypothetical protein
MAVGSGRRSARREWARRETPELAHGIRRRLLEALAGAAGPNPRTRAESAVQAVVQEVKVEILRLTGDLDLALHAGRRTKEICLETLRGLQYS